MAKESSGENGVYHPYLRGKRWPWGMVLTHAASRRLGRRGGVRRLTRAPGHLDLDRVGVGTDEMAGIATTRATPQRWGEGGAVGVADSQGVPAWNAAPLAIKDPENTAVNPDRCFEYLASGEAG